MAGRLPAQTVLAQVHEPTIRSERHHGFERRHPEVTWAEHLYPGVYIVEVPVASHPIPGVSTSTSDIVGAETIAKLQRLVERVPPDWTDARQHDPAVAVLELLAWLADALAARMDQVSDEGYLASARLALASVTLLGDRRPPKGSVVERVRFFTGKLLDEKDLSNDQEYQRCLKIGVKREVKLALASLH